MKLLVVVIFVLALLYVFFTVIGPAYIWQENPPSIINEGLGKSETDLGQYFTKVGSFSKEYTVQAQGFESDGRSIVFECNNPIYCCEEDAECNKVIEWSNSGDRYFAIQEDKEIDVSTRCRFEEIYICKVFLGAEPAQVELIEEPVVSEEVDISKSKTLPLNFSVLNSGKKGMSGTIASAKLFKIKKMPFGQEPEKVLVEEFSTDRFSLAAGDKTELGLGVEIPGNGDYLIKFTVFESGDKTNFESKEFEFTAIGEQAPTECIPGKMKIQELEKCVYILPCECSSLTKCNSLWRGILNIPAEKELELVSADEENVTFKYSAEYLIPDWCDPETMECEEYCQEKEVPEPICLAGGCIEDKTRCRVWLTCNCDPGADPNSCIEVWTQKLGSRELLPGTYLGKPALYLPGLNKTITQIYCDHCGKTIPTKIDCCELPAVGACGGKPCTDSIVESPTPTPTPTPTLTPTPTPTPQTCTDGVPRIGQCIQDNVNCQLIFPCVCLDKTGCIDAWKQKLRAKYPNIDAVSFNEYRQGGVMVGVYVAGQDNRNCDECEEHSQICLQGILGLDGCSVRS